MMRIPLLLLALLFTTVTHAADRSDEYYEAASSYFFKEDYESAIIELKNALQADPEHVPSLLLMGQTRLKKGEPVAAEEALIKARVLGADPGLITLQLAQAYLEQAKYKQIVESLSPGGLSPKETVELLGYRAEAWLGLGNEPEAAAEIQKADDIDPTALHPNLARVLLELRLDNLDKAEQTARSIIRRHPASAAAFNSLGSVLHAQGNLQDALANYAAAIELDAKLIDARIARIGLLLDLQRYTGTLPDLDYLDENFPYEPRAAYLRGLVFRRLATPDNDYGERSIEELRKCTEVMALLPPAAIASDPQMSMAAALAHFSLGEFESSKIYLENYLKKEPYDLGANRLYGNVLIKLNDPLNAIRVLRTTKQAYPQDAGVTDLLAQAYSQIGKHEQAAQLLESMQQGGHSGPETSSRLAINLLQSGYARAGLSGLERAFQEFPESTQTGFNLAIAQLREGRAEQALQTIERLLSLQPDNLAYLNLNAVALRAAGQLEAARELYARLVQQYPDALPLRINHAKTLELQGNIDQSRFELRQLQEAHPDQAAVLLAQAQLEQRQGNLDDAIRLAEAARTGNPDDLTTRQLLVNLYLELKDYDAAQNLALETTETFNNDFASSQLLASTFAQSGATRRAISIYKRLARQAGFNTDALYGIAQSQIELRDWDSARHALFKAIQGDPQHIPSHILYIQTQLMLRDYKDAQQSAGRLLELAPELATAWQLAGDTALAREQFPAAEEFYQQGLAIELQPELLQGYYRALMSQGKIRQARDYLANLWSGSNPPPIVGAMYSEALMQEADWNAARRVIAELLKSGIESASLRNNMAYVLAKLGDPEALSQAQLAHKLEPANPMVNDTLGWLLVESGRAEEALKYLRQAVSRLSDNPELRYHLGVALLNTGRADEGRKELQIALDLGRPFEGQETARELLKSVTGITN